MVQSLYEILEESVEKYGIKEVCFTLQRVCDAEAIRLRQKDLAAHARRWESAGDRIFNAALKIEVV